MERLTGLDASFLYVETPQMHMHVAMVAVLDAANMPGGYSFERIVELIEGRIHLVPPLRRRLLEVPFALHHPLWIDDPDFDIIHHVRRVACPAPGGLKELGEIAGRINSTPLDRSRPLWEAWVIEGLEDGRVAILAKVHHSAVDGTSGAGLLVHLFDLTRDAQLPPPPERKAPDHVPTDVELVRYAAISRLRQPADFFKVAKQTAQAVSDVIKLRRNPGHDLGAAPLTAPRTRWNGPLTAKRLAAFSRLPLDGLKTIKKAFDCKLNDVVLAVTAGALRNYLDNHDELPEQALVGVCPISVREGPTSGEANNKVSAMFTSLATDIDDPAERLRTIASSTVGAKEEHNAIGADMLQNWAEFAAPRTFNLAARFYSRLKLADHHRPIHNIIISNVPGPPFPIYMAGAELVAAYPMGPVMEGAGLNVTVMSYKGSVDFGFMVAADLLPDVWDMAAEVENAYLELLQAAQTAAEERARAALTQAEEAEARAAAALAQAAQAKAEEAALRRHEAAAKAALETTTASEPGSDESVDDQAGDSPAGSPPAE